MFTRYTLFAWLIFFFLLPNLTAQTNTSSQTLLETIHFKGLKRTQENFLRQFIHSKIGEPITDSLLREDVQMLKNISSLGNANYRLDTSGQKMQVTFEVEEVKTLLPILNFGGIEGNIWFQVGFSDINWRGKGQFLSASYQNTDGLHSGNIYYKVPQINGSNWGFSASLNKWSSREPLFFPEGTVNYDYDNNGIGLTAIRNFGIRRNIEIGGTYFIEEYEQSALQFLEVVPGPDALRQPKWLAKLAYTENFLNYNTFYLEGLAWQILSQNVYNTLEKSWFHSLQLQMRYYNKPNDKGNFAARLRIGIANNDNTPFAPFVADSYTNIRGIGNRIDRGTAQVVINAEYRRTLLENKKWGAQAVVFSDTGTWRNPGGQLKDLVNPDQFRQFLGGGFRLIYNKVYGAVLRVDYGVDIFNPSERGIVIGLGQYF